MNNLNKYYGKSFIGLEKLPPSYFFSTRQPPPFPSSSCGAEAPDNTLFCTKDQMRSFYFDKQLSFIDVRDSGEQECCRLRRAVALHYHDLLSGACNEILPSDKGSELVVFAAHRQRAVNAFNALRRWGYHNVIAADFESLRFILEEELKT